MKVTILPAWFISSQHDQLAKNFMVSSDEFERMQRGRMTMLYTDQNHEATLQRWKDDHYNTEPIILRPIAYIAKQPE